MMILVSMKANRGDARKASVAQCPARKRKKRTSESPSVRSRAPLETEAEEEPVEVAEDFPPCFPFVDPLSGVATDEGMPGSA